MSPCTIPCIDSRGNRVATLSVTNDAGRVLSVAYTNAAGYSVGYTVTLPNGGTFRREIVRDPAFPERVLACTNYFGSTAVTGFAYAYDLLGRPVSRNADAFAYDTRGQVTNVVRGGLYPETDSYAYDLAGNRTFSTDSALANQTWTANALNQYTSSTWNGFSHDADGNLKTVGGIATFFWDAENRFVALSNANGVTRYAYDWRHRRVRVSDTGHWF